MAALEAPDGVHTAFSTRLAKPVKLTRSSRAMVLRVPVQWVSSASQSCGQMGQILAWCVRFQTESSMSATNLRSSAMLVSILTGKASRQISRPSAEALPAGRQGALHSSWPGCLGWQAPISEVAGTSALSRKFAAMQLEVLMRQSSSFRAWAGRAFRASFGSLDRLGLIVFGCIVPVLISLQLAPPMASVVTAAVVFGYLVRSRAGQRPDDGARDD